MSKHQNISDSDRALAESHFNRGRQLWKAGDRAAAITEYNNAIALNPDSPARTALQMATEIMDFYDKDRYNP